MPPMSFVCLALCQCAKPEKLPNSGNGGFLGTVRLVVELHARTGSERSSGWSAAGRAWVTCRASEMRANLLQTPHPRLRGAPVRGLWRSTIGI